MYACKSATHLQVPSAGSHNNTMKLFLFVHYWAVCQPDTRCHCRAHTKMSPSMHHQRSSCEAHAGHTRRHACSTGQYMSTAAVTGGTPVNNVLIAVGGGTYGYGRHVFQGICGRSTPIWFCSGGSAAPRPCSHAGAICLLVRGSSPECL